MLINNHSSYFSNKMCGCHSVFLQDFNTKDSEAGKRPQKLVRGTQEHCFFLFIKHVLNTLLCHLEN